MEISRREFLKYLGITTAGASLVGLGYDTIWSVPDELYEQVGGMPRLETWKTSVCSLCPGGCGIKVRLIDGIPVRILGNPIHPVNRGGICPMGEAGIESLFNPDRLKQPLKQAGDRGGNQWESISWEEAIQTVVSRLQGLRERGESHRVAFFRGSDNNLLASLIERFMQAYGSPNLFDLDQTRASTLPTYLTQGHTRTFGYDFDKLDLLVNFGADFLDIGPSPVRFNQLYAKLRSRTEGARARILHIDTRLSRTASISNEWIPIKPGTMAALALGVANVLIKDSQYDADFVKTRCFGFDDWQDDEGNTHRGFRALVEQDYYPAKVSEITGVPADRIVELARELGGAESALVLAGGQAAHSYNSVYTLWAVDCLNALKGNFRTAGPIAIPASPPLADFPQTQADDIAQQGLRQPRLTQPAGRFCFPEFAGSRLPGVVGAQQPYSIDTLFLLSVNPVFTSINQGEIVKALSTIPFIVSFSPFLDETAAYADLILPDHSFLEKYEAFLDVPMVTFAHLGVQQPMIEPLYDTRHTGDVVLQIARDLGGTVAPSLPWPDYTSYLQDRLRGIYETGAGTIFTERMDESWLKYLKERGWQIVEYSTFEEFWQVLLEKGGWWDPFPPETDFGKLFQTPSKKFEFYSQILAQEVKAQLPAGQPAAEAIASLLAKWKISARGDLVFLPHYEEAKIKEGGEHFALHLLTYNLITNVNGAGSNLPLVQELFGMLAREYWRSWIEMSPETAHQHGIGEADMVKVTSPHGSLEVKVKLLPGIMPDVVYIPFGLGHRAYGRYAKGVGVNPYEILSVDHDSLGGEPSLISTKVTIQKASRKERA